MAKRALPPPALDRIVGSVDQRSDVLNVALSNKAFYSVAVPHHLHYHDIRSRLHNPTLWSWFIRQDDLSAANVRSLTILSDDNFQLQEMMTANIYDYRQRIPACIPGATSEDQKNQRMTPETPGESEKRLVSALQRMTGLQIFRWYRMQSPVLEGQDDIWSTLDKLGTVQEVDVLDEGFQPPSTIFPAIPIALSDTLLRFSGFTTFTLRTSVCNSSNNPDIPQLEQMLLNNCPDLQVLALELAFTDFNPYTANIESLLKNALWPNLRVLQLQGVNCRVPELTRFLIAHPSLQELGLAQMMPGHAWTRLELPADVLPNLRRLQCSSAQAAAVLKHTSCIRLGELLGVEVHDTVIDSEYFKWDSDWENEDHEDPDMERPSPWKASFLDCLRAQNSITCLEIVSINTPQEMETLSVVAPQLRELRFVPTMKENSIRDAEWIRLYSLFPHLEVIWDHRIICFDPHKEHIEEANMNINIQTVAKSVPRLRLISAGPWIGAPRKVVILRGGEAHTGVKWVVRQWEESEEQCVKDGERVYGTLPGYKEILKSWWNLFALP